MSHKFPQYFKTYFPIFIDTLWEWFKYMYMHTYVYDEVEREENVFEKQN